MLHWAGRHADTVGLSGLGRTLADGHNHEVRWNADELEAQLQHVSDGAKSRQELPVLEALVQQVTITNDAEAAVAELSNETGTSSRDLLASPFLLVGTHQEILDKTEELGRRWGITHFVVRENAISDIEGLVASADNSTTRGSGANG